MQINICRNVGQLMRIQRKLSSEIVPVLENEAKLLLKQKKKKVK